MKSISISIDIDVDNDEKAAALENLLSSIYITGKNKPAKGKDSAQQDKDKN